MRFLKNRCLISILVFLFSFSLLFATLEDMGVTIDEPYVNRAAGISFVAWLGVAVEDIAKGDWGHFTSKKVIKEYFPPEYTYHPPFARFLTGITWKLFHESIGEIRALRLAPALLFSISVALLFLLVSGSYGVAPGLLASLSLALCPAPFGHAHLIALDSQIASMWLITAFCFIKGLHSRRWAVLFAVSAGLAMNTKIHGFAVPFPLFLWGVLFFRNKILPNALALLIISPLILFLTNPDYWNSPHHLFYFFDAMWTKGSYQKIATHFLGERYGFSPPKYYAFFMILISIPPLTLILALCGAALGSKQEIQNRLKAPPGRVGLSVFLSLNALAALGLTLLKNIPIYDGVRLFLPAFPFVSGLAGVGLFYLIRFLKQEKLKPVVSYGVLLATLSTSAYSLAKIHPFELSYFNLFIGGLPGAKKAGLESTYWNSAFTVEVAQIMNERYSNKSFFHGRGLEPTFKYYKETGILNESITGKKIDYDYFLLEYRQGWFKEKQWFYADYMTPEYTVQKEGVPLFGIFKALKTQLKERPDLTAENAGRNITPRGFEWSRYLIAPEAGLYKFAVFSAFQHKLWIDKVEVKSLRPQRFPSFVEYRMNLNKGVHTVDFLFPNAKKQLEFYLVWATPSGEKGLIPPDALIAPRTAPHPAP